MLPAPHPHDAAPAGTTACTHPGCVGPTPWAACSHSLCYRRCPGQSRTCACHPGTPPAAAAQTGPAVQTISASCNVWVGVFVRLVMAQWSQAVQCMHTMNSSRTSVMCAADAGRPASSAPLNLDSTWCFPRPGVIWDHDLGQQVGRLALLQHSILLRCMLELHEAARGALCSLQGWSTGNAWNAKKCMMDKSLAMKLATCRDKQRNGTSCVIVGTAKQGVHMSCVEDLPCRCPLLSLTLVARTHLGCEPLVHHHQSEP